MEEPALNQMGSLIGKVSFRSSGTTQPRAPSMAQRAWMTSMVLYLLKVSGSAEKPAVSCADEARGRGEG